MHVHKNLDALPVFTNAVISIGTFDGVHTGHKIILKQLKEEAQRIKGETVVITFNPHPRRIIENQHSEIRLLNTLNEKIELLASEGINHFVIVPFTKEFAGIQALDYVEKFLVHFFHPHTIIIGYDHRFGHKREGNYQLLEALKEKFKYHVKEIPEYILKNVIISSTKIRQAIINGHIEIANHFLGYEYFFEGEIMSGNKLGRTIGYPTANIQINDEEKLVPGNGVYAVTVKIQSEKYQNQIFGGMMNIGMRPTVGGTRRTIEVNIFNFDDNVYHQRIRISVKKYLRGEVKFNNLESLKQQLEIDKQNALNLFY